MNNLKRILQGRILSSDQCQSYLDGRRVLAEDSLISFDQFKSVADESSYFTYMLRYHGSNLAFVLEWAISQLTQLCKAKTNGSKKWSVFSV